jgi:AraC-like DNA-binding protein
MSSILLELPGSSDVQGGLWYSTPASTRFGRHHHQELELNVIVSGEACYWFAHRELRVVAPAAIWIPPRVEHELLNASHDLSMWVHSFRVPARQGEARQGEASRAESARVPPSSVPEALREIGDAPRITGLAPAGLARVCARSREGLLRPGLPRFNDILSEILAVAWSERCLASARRESVASHPTARRAARLLREPDSFRSMAALARSTPLSRERLSRVFAQCYGIGLIQYRSHYRVQRFIRTYGNGSDENMLRAALEVGFGSYVQFHRAFKQVVGYSPARHLARVRDGIIDPARTGGSPDVG